MKYLITTAISIKEERERLFRVKYQDKGWGDKGKGLFGEVMLELRAEV